jgi:hypothetical protein
VGSGSLADPSGIRGRERGGDVGFAQAGQTVVQGLAEEIPARVNAVAWRSPPIYGRLSVHPDLHSLTPQRSSLR